jgi:uncharacterized protein YbaA (DUF1428 family)
MSYFNSIVLAVPAANKERYLAFAREHWPTFQRHGALRMIELWGVDVPEGQLTDFRRSVQARPDETVVVSLIEWADQDACQAAWTKMMQDPAFAALGVDRPFDGKRMFWGGFAPLFDSSQG